MNAESECTKRAIDIVGGAAGLALAAPILALAACAIKLEDGGPILFRQERLGRGERRFEILKLRTMTVDAEKLRSDGVVEAGDPRITRVGKFLRRTRLDELPQFLNVLMGDMSIVGPRPERPELAEQLAMAIPYFEERMRDVKPGITGLAQINLSYTGKPFPDSHLAKYEQDLTNPFKMEGTEDALADHMRIKLLYDLAYSAATEELRTFLPLELSILVKTPLVMLRALGT